MITSKSRRSVLHPIVAIFFFLNLEGYSVGVVLGFVGFGLPLQQAAAPPPASYRWYEAWPVRGAKACSWRLSGKPAFMRGY